MNAFTQVAEASRLLLDQGFSSRHVTTALEKVGRALKVDRVYIFENSNDPKTGELLTSQRYEWSANSAMPQLDNPELQNVEVKDIAPSWIKPMQRGMHVAGLVRDQPSPVRELLESQQIVSVLVCPIMVGTEWWGFVGFDDCRTERKWPPDEIAVLSALARALAGSLRHQKIAKRFNEANSRLKEVIDRCAAIGV